MTLFYCHSALDAESGKNISHRLAPIYTDKHEEKKLMVDG